MPLMRNNDDQRLADAIWGKDDCKSHKYPSRPSRSCGVLVCVVCEHHDGLVRCFCGWSLSGQNGYQELIEMGERIEEDC